MKKILAILLLFVGFALGQDSGPQIPLTGSIGVKGSVAILGSASFSIADANHVLTANEYASNFLLVTSSASLTATRNLVAPLNVGQQFTVENATTGGQAIQIIGPTGTGVTIPNGQTVSVASDGTNYLTISSGPNQFVLFTNVTSATITASASPTNVITACYDNSSPANKIDPASTTMDLSTYIITFTFAVPQSGYCVINQSGGGGTSGGAASPAGFGGNLQTNNGSGGLGAVANVASGSQVVSNQAGNGFITQLKPVVDVRDYGAVGDCSTDDTAALQAALNASFNVSGNGSRPVVIPPPPNGGDCYLISTQLTYGDPTVQLNGVSITGGGMHASRIKYVGTRAGGGGLRVYNPNNSYFANLEFIDGTGGDNAGTNQADTGLWLDPSNTSGGTGNTLVNIRTSGFVDGLRLGHLSLSDVNDMAETEIISFKNIGAYNGIHIIGSNTDGVMIEAPGLEWEQYPIRCESCRNVHIKGVQYTGLTGSAQADRVIFFYGDGGNIGDAPITIDGCRIEQGAMLFWIGSQGANNESHPMNVKVSNCGYASAEAVQTVVAPTGLTLTPSSSGGFLNTGNYCVRLAALDGQMGQSAPTSESCHTFGSGSTNSLAVSWTAAANAAMTRIYMGVSGPGSEQYFAQVWQPATSYELTQYGSSSDQAYAGTSGVPSSSTNGTASTIGWFGETGTLQISGSRFRNPGTNFQFGRLNGTGLVTFSLESNSLNNLTPDDPFSVVKGWGASAGSNTPGLEYTSIGNLSIDASDVQHGFFENRMVSYGSTVTETVVNNLDTPQVFTQHVTIPSLTFGPTSPLAIAGGPSVWYQGNTAVVAGGNVTSWPDSSGNGKTLSPVVAYTIAAGGVLSGTFTFGEQVIQQVSGASANLIGTVIFSNSPMVIGPITGTPDANAAHLWVGQTSAATYTPGSAPVLSTAPPTVISNANGQQAVAFSTAGLFSAGVTISQPYTVFVVYRDAVATPSGHEVIVSDYVNNDAWGYVNVSGSPLIGTQTSTPPIWANLILDTNYHLFVSSTCGGTTTIKYEGQTITGATGSSSINGLGLGYGALASNGDFYFLAGNIAEAGIFSSCLNAADLAALTSYENGIYALAGTPSTIVWNYANIVPGLNADLLDGARWNAPGAIGGTTPGVGNFSSLNVNGSLFGAAQTGTSAVCETAGVPTTLATGATTTDTGLNCLPANSIIDSVVARVTTTITSACTGWELGDAATPARFSSNNTTLTSGTVTDAAHIGTFNNTGIASATTGTWQAAAAKVRITCAGGNPGAGAIRVIVFYHTWTAPTS